MNEVSAAETIYAARDHGQRQRILCVAETLFREMGLSKTTVADIARELRMSPANVYRFFPSKAAIQEAVAANVVGEIAARAQDIASGSGLASDKLRRIVKAIETHNRERLAVNRRLHEMVELALSERWPIVSSHISVMRAIFAQVLAQGAVSGEFIAMDADKTAGLLQAACVTFAHPRLLVECADLEMPTCDDMMDFLIAALRKK